MTPPASRSGTRIDFTASLHNATKRDYVARVVEHDKAECAEIAGRFGEEYWDGPRQYGYGGYRYDGRWLPVAEAIARHYGLASGDRVLDVGCGKGFLLHELTRAVPGLQISGIDVSGYAIANAHDPVRPFVSEGHAESLPYDDDAFDVVLSLGTLHNLGAEALYRSLAEIERVARRSAYVMVESYRSEREKANLLYWQLTCRSFYSVEDWEFVFKRAGYTGDYGFIFFE
jgi:SAM-dependent methyltransferase